MENYTVEINLKNKYEDCEDFKYDIELLFKQNNILITSFFTEFNCFNEKFINKFDTLKNKGHFELYDYNGCVIITKNENYLTFNTSSFGGACYGKMEFTVLITDEILLMIETVKTIKQNLK